MSFNKSLCVALGVMAATSVMAYEQSFESGTAGTEFTGLTGWGGYGTYSNTTAEARTLVAGVPLTNATHDVHLAVDGWVTNTLDGTAGDAQLDMLVKVAKPDEELSGMSDGEAKFAMAIDLDGTLKYWTGSAWSALGATAYTEGQWIRVAVIYDQTGQRCKVSVDGNACVTETGYKTATTNLMGGAWYPVIQATTKIASLKVVGTTALDDISVTHVANINYTPDYTDPVTHEPITIAETPAAGGSVAVPLSWFDENSITTNTTDATDGSGMKIADKYITGLDPNDGSKFEMTDMTMTKVGETVKAVVTVPATTPAPGYTIKVQTKSGASGAWTSEGATRDGNNVTIPLPAGDNNVSYFRMVVEPES